MTGHGWVGSGTNLYLFTGIGGVGGASLLWAFSTTNSSWAQLADGPIRFQSYMCFGASGGLIYLLGGNSTFSYIPADNAWTEHTGSVTVEGGNQGPRYGGALLDVGGELLLVHGSDTNTGIAQMPPRFLCSNVV